MIGFSENCYFADLKVEQFSVGKIILSTYVNTNTLFFRNTSLWTLLRMLKHPNSRACALETAASFFALPVPCFPGPGKDARGRETLRTRMILAGNFTLVVWSCSISDPNFSCAVYIIFWNFTISEFFRVCHRKKIVRGFASFTLWLRDRSLFIVQGGGWGETLQL
jgi:hypothetical protein